MVKISIITATYNSAKTIRDTFDSVLRQHYSDYEYIVVDGSSTDGTLDIIREYEPKFEGHMVWKSEPDKGIYDAMNKGISRSTGDVVGILNSDDFFTSSAILHAIAKAFENFPGIDAVYGDVHYVDESDTSHRVRYYSDLHFKRWWMRLGFMPAHPSFYCKKSVYDKFQIPKKTVAEGLMKMNSKHRVEEYHEPFYFNTSYKVAADFECLLRLIFKNRIKTHYMFLDFVTMRTGGASSSGVESHKQINRDHMRAFKENGVYSNYFLISLRYLYKIGELVLGKIKS